MRHDDVAGPGGTATANRPGQALGIGIDQDRWTFGEDKSRATEVMDMLERDGFRTLSMRSLVAPESRELIGWTVEAYSDGPAWTGDQLQKLASIAEEHGTGFIITCQHAADQTFYAAETARLVRPDERTVQLAGDPLDTGLVARFI